MMPWLLLAGAYFIGAFPTSYLVGKLARGIDLRQHGSGNLGATNAYRVMGWRAAAPIFVVDIFKGWLPVVLFATLDGKLSMLWALAYGAAAILGHVYSIFVGFRGGKGVATSAGVFLALAPYAVLAILVAWTTIVLLTGYVSLASITAAFMLPVLVLLMQGANPVFWLSLALGTFVVFAHRANIRRLLRGEEHRFRRGVAAHE